MVKHVHNMNKKSFTLIELIIVVGIITIFTGISLASYNTFNDQAKLKTETQKFADILELAKKKAASSDSPVACQLTSYKVIAGASSSYTFQRCCVTSGCSTLSTYNISPLIFATNKTVDFTPLTGDANLQSFQIQNASGSQSMYVCVNTKGVIEVKTTACP